MSPSDLSEPLVASNLATLAFRRLEQAIIQVDLKPGERLSEAGLARRFGISRGPLREAIGQLEGRKLVQRVTNQGARVVSMSNAELIDLMVIMESLEGMACRLAATRMTDEELSSWADMLADHADIEAVITGRGYFQGTGDRDFHARIVRARGNARRLQILDIDLYSLLRLYRQRLSMRPGRPGRALAEHREILEALRSRDPDWAETAMRAHIRSSRANVEALMYETAADEDLTAE